MTRDVLVVRLAGTQEQMGHQHGALLAEVGGWQPVQAFFPRMPHRLLYVGTHRTWVESAALGAAVPLLDAWLHRLERHRSPELRRRSRAFLTALGADPGHSRYLGVMDVFQNAVGVLARTGLVPFARRAASGLPAACSSLVAWGATTSDGRVLHARNFDFPGIGVWERAPEVVFCSPTDGLRYGFATARGADVPGITAFNEAGLTVTMHTRFHRDVSFSGRSAVDLGHELIRRARSIDEAVDAVRANPSASGWALVVSSAREGRGVVIEVCASRVEVTDAWGSEAFVATTNRYHHPALQVDEVAPSTAFIDNCEGRLDALRRHARRGGLDVADLQRMLGDQHHATGPRATGAVLAQPDTVHSIVTDLDRGCVYVSAGDCPTGRGGFARVPLAWDGPELAEITAAPPRGDTGPYARGTRAEAVAHYVEAVRREAAGEAIGRIGDAIEAAVGADPDEPGYRFIAGAIRLHCGDPHGGLAHLEHQLTVERATFSRGQALLWASRAADAAGQPERARALRRELVGVDHPLLRAHHHAALREETRPWTARRLRGVPVSARLVDAG